jgi:hypothetical protein
MAAVRLTCTSLGARKTLDLDQPTTTARVFQSDRELLSARSSSSTPTTRASAMFQGYAARQRVAGGPRRPFSGTGCQASSQEQARWLRRLHWPVLPPRQIIAGIEPQQLWGSVRLKPTIANDLPRIEQAVGDLLVARPRRSIPQTRWGRFGTCSMREQPVMKLVVTVDG